MAITNQLIFSALGGILMLGSLITMFVLQSRDKRRYEKQVTWASYVFVAGLVLIAAGWFL